MCYFITVPDLGEGNPGLMPRALIIEGSKFQILNS